MMQPTTADRRRRPATALPSERLTATRTAQTRWPDGASARNRRAFASALAKSAGVHRDDAELTLLVPLWMQHAAYEQLPTLPSWAEGLVPRLFERIEDLLHCTPALRDQLQDETPANLQAVVASLRQDAGLALVLDTAASYDGAAHLWLVRIAWTAAHVDLVKAKAGGVC